MYCSPAATNCSSPSLLILRAIIVDINEGELQYIGKKTSPFRNKRHIDAIFCFQSAAVFKLLLLPVNLWLQNVTSKGIVIVNLFEVVFPCTCEIKAVGF